MTTSAAETLGAAFEQHQAGNHAMAEQLYRQAIAQDPQRAEAWHLLGALYLQAGQAAEAVRLITRAIQLQPADSGFFSNLGTAYSLLGQHDEAVTCLRRAVQLAPQSTTAHYNLGTALAQQGRHEEAVASFRHAIAANPESAEAHYNLGNSLRELGQLPEAESAYREAIRARPDYLKARVNLGNVLRDQSRLAEAASELRAALKLDPNHAATHLNLGATLRDLGENVEAVECLKRAVELDPTKAEAHNNLGTVLQALGHYDEARSAYEEALQRNPQLADAHFSRATDLLRRGQLAEGFAEYEWRWKCPGFREGRFAQPRWDGSPLAGRTILCWSEQGLGDTLQLVRFTRAAKKRGGRVIVECQPLLVQLLSRCAGIDRVIAAGSPLEPFDVQIPMFSLPGVLKLSIDNLWRGPYLTADEQLVARWRTTLAPLGGFRVGVCWRGNPKQLFDRQRSFALAELAPVAALEGVRLIGLQKTEGRDEIASSRFAVADLGPSLDEASGAFMDTAAVMKSLDLVITCDTAVAHLAGGLGVPTWVALAAHADWRWFMDRDDSPWYGTMRLFRQRVLDDWHDVFARMTDALRVEMAR